MDVGRVVVEGGHLEGWLGRSLPSKAGGVGVSHGICGASVGSGRGSCTAETRARSLSSSVSLKMAFVFHRSQMRNATCNTQRHRASDRSMSTDHVSFPSTVPDQTPQKEESGARKLGPSGRILYLRMHNFFPTKLFPLLFNAPFLDSAGHCAQQVLGFLPSAARVPSM